MVSVDKAVGGSNHARKERAWTACSGCGIYFVSPICLDKPENYLRDRRMEAGLQTQKNEKGREIMSVQIKRCTRLEGERSIILDLGRGVEKSYGTSDREKGFWGGGPFGMG